jgi:hypothetical protein
MAKSLRDIIVPRAGRNVPKGEADFLDTHKVVEKDYPVKQKPSNAPHQTDNPQDNHPTAPKTEEMQFSKVCNKTNENVSCPVHGMKECMSEKANVIKEKGMKENAEVDFEGEMAKSQLKALANKSAQLSMMMHDDQQLEAWVQSKIANAKQMVDGVYDYLMYRDKPETPAKETTGPDSAMQFPAMNTDNNYGAV